MAFSSGKGNKSITVSIFVSILVFLPSLTEGTIPGRARGTVMETLSSGREPDSCSSKEQGLVLGISHFEKCIAINKGKGVLFHFFKNHKFSGVLMIIVLLVSVRICSVASGGQEMAPPQGLENEKMKVEVGACHAVVNKWDGRGTCVQALPVKSHFHARYVVKSCKQSLPL